MFPNHILSYYNECMQIKNGFMPIPRMVLFSLSSRCNASCEYCIYKKENKNGKVMEEGKAFDIINELANYGVKAIDLCGGGEPLTTPYIDKLFFHINKIGLKFGVISNGINLTGDVMKNIIQHGTYVRVSYDSADKEIYKKCKGVDKAEQVFNNLVEACKYRELTQSRCEIAVKIGLSEDNYDLGDLIKTVVALKKLPLNRISLRLLRKTDKEVKGIDTLINIQNTLKLWDIQYTPENLSISFEKTAINKKCWMNPIHSVITDSGEVYLCCYYVGREKLHSIGNINKNTFAEIWESKTHKDKLKLIDKDKCNEYDCKFHSHHDIMEQYLEVGTPEFC